MDSTDIDSQVYLGLWTNWSQGSSVMGATLTLTRSQGNLLIAFTASFVTWVAVHFWHILCVAYHRSLSTPSPRSALHHQRLVVLRNSAAAEPAFWSIIAIAAAWYRITSPRRLFLALAPIFCLAVLVMTGFTVAAGFSSSIASAAGNTVLLNASDCGLPLPATSISKVAITDAAISAALDNALNYARQCYSQDASSMVDCGRFVQSSISWQTTTGKASCPFGEGICRSRDRNLRLDTGPMDMDAAFGLNLAPHERASFRYVLHCAPLVTEEYTSTVNNSNATIVRYHYGSDEGVSVGPDGEPIKEEIDYLYQMRDVDAQYEYISDEGRDYLSGTNMRLAAIRSGNWKLIPSLSRPDADLTLLFLSGNGIQFAESFPDDWYRVSPSGETNVFSEVVEQIVPVYRPSEAASPMGCTEQFQWCNLGNTTGGDDDSSSCGPLLGFHDAVVQAAPLFNSSVADMADLAPPPPGNRDAARLWWMAMVANQNHMSLVYLIDYLASRALASQVYVYAGVMTPSALVSSSSTDGDAPQLWHEDVKMWFTATLAGLQAAFVKTPLGDEGGADRYAPETAEQAELCGAQRVLSQEYTSFSVFGLCFLYVAGAVVVLVSVLLEPALRLAWRRYGYREYQQVAWTMDNAVQLQRLAQEEAGYPVGDDAGWRNCGDEVPVVSAGEITEVVKGRMEEAPLGGFDLRDPFHLVIARPHAETPTSDKGGSGAVEGAKGPCVQGSNVEVSSTTSCPVVETLEDDQRQFHPELDEVRSVIAHSGADDETPACSPVTA